MTRKGIKLIAPDKHGILCYQGNCKLKVDTLSKILKIEPKSEEYNDISALFQWKFIQKKNLLFVFAEIKIQDFVLIFANEETCKTVYDRIYKKRVADSVQKEELEQRLLIPIFQIISANIYSTRFKKAMFEWIEKHEENEKKELLKLLKKQKNKHQILDVKNIKQESKNLISGRKRRFSEMRNYNTADTNEEEYSENVDSNFNNVKAECDEIQFQRERMALSTTIKIINESRFKIVNVKHQNGFYRKLLIFTSVERTNCFEYKFYPSKQIFYHKCKSSANGIKAALKFDENGNDCIEFEDKKHVCSPLNYVPERYMEMKIVKKPNYEIIENCGTKSKRMLIIFNPEDRNQCYEYYWCSLKKKFQCCGCRSERKYISAEICHENTVNECLQLHNDTHVCEIRNYNPEKFNQIYKYVLSPDFEIQTKIIKDGKERKTLIIFDQSNRKLCYYYYFETCKNAFYCSGCHLKHKTVSASLSQNNDGVEYVILSNAKHVCSPKEYIPQTEIILRPPKFKFFEANEKNISKLIIFVPNNNQLCYIFSPNSGENRFKCLGCLQTANRKRKLPSGNECKSKRIVSVYLCKNDSSNGSGEYYVKMLDNQKHICEPRTYELEKLEMKILRPKDDYILIENKTRKTGLPYLIIYDPNDKTLCFKYYYFKFGKVFLCGACEMKKTRVTAQYHRDSNGNEYILTNQKKHVCSPIKISTIINSNTVILEEIDLFLKETKAKNKEIDESQIIRLPNFELQSNKSGVPDRKLIIFKSDDKELCYEYGYHKAFFECYKCKITAKLHHDSENDNEKYIVLNKIEHKCLPVKYVPDMKIIKAPNFMVFNRDDDSKLTKLIIFTSVTKDMCYEFSFVQDAKCFRCCACCTLKKKVSAKLLEYENGAEYVQLLKNDHICTPKKFVLEEFQPKIIPESGFMLCPNKNGKPNSKLILFDPKKDGFCYEYYLDRNIFKCNQCSNKKKYVNAKLCEKDDGEKYLELLNDEHICEPKKFVLEEFQPKIIPESGFKLFCNQNGKENSKLILFDSEKDRFCYEYYLLSNKLFLCNQCSRKKKTVTAKLCEKQNGEKYLELSVEKHICKSRKYDPKNYKENEKKTVFNNFVIKHNTNGMPNSRLTIFDENDKTLGYQYSLQKSKNIFLCLECNKKSKSISAKLLIDGNGKQTIKFGKTEHVCIIQNLKEKNIIFEHFKFEENGNVLIANHPIQNGKYYKFKFDNQISAYCCIKCKEEKKKIITATKCNGNDGKEFWLLNYKHFCNALSK